MGNVETSNYTAANRQLNVAQAELEKIQRTVHAGAEDLKNWREMWPAYKTYLSDYRAGNKTFDPHSWPDGQMIAKALSDCHDANRVLEKARNALLKEDCEALGLKS